MMIGWCSPTALLVCTTLLLVLITALPSLRPLSLFCTELHTTHTHTVRHEIRETHEPWYVREYCVVR